MLVSLAGAMSTAELGKSLAEMIRQEKSPYNILYWSKFRGRHHELSYFIIKGF